MNRAASVSIEKRVSAAICIWLIACVTGFVIISYHWPMITDTPLMHYVVFLMHHGKEPYRDIVEMNLPSTYMLEAFVMRFMGPGAVAWRLYDFALIAIAASSMVSILRPLGTLPGILAAALFTLVHAQDGVMMVGERDFAAAAFLLAAVALLFAAFRGDPQGKLADKLLFLHGAVLGTALTIKPTLLPLALLLSLCTAWFTHLHKGKALVFATATIAGLLIPVAGSIVFLLRHGALPAFWGELNGLIPYHASFQHRPLPYLFLHSLSPLLPLFLAWIAAAALLSRRETSDPQHRPERAALLLAALGGLISYLLQRKGFPYQRYPLTGFLITLIALDFGLLVRRPNRISRIVGWCGIALGAVLCAQFLTRSARFDRFDEPRPILSDLESLNVQQQQVQCMDTLGNCIGSLYAGRIVQSTGFLYDCYMLDGSNPVALDLRRRFWLQMQLNPPTLIVVTDSNCYEAARTFDKYLRWPEFQRFLNVNYTLARQSGPQQPVRYWSRTGTPFDYRIYKRR